MRRSLGRTVYLAATSLAAMLILVPVALAQDAGPGDDDPLAEEQNVVVLEEEALEQTVGRQLPQQPATDEPIDEPGGPAPKGGVLPTSGGMVAPSALLLPAAALLLGSGVLAYAVLRRRG